MAEALAKKKRTRAGHKASATRTVGKIEGILAEDVPDLSRLALLRLTLKEKLDTINTLDAEVVDLIEDETGLTEEIERADTYKETLFSALIKADRLITDSSKTPTTRGTSPTIGETPASKYSATRLPKLQLRHFNGDLTKWNSFWQSFEAAVDSNRELSAVEKFNYLSSLLDGAAKEAVAGLSLTEANYAQAVIVLKKRFGGTQQIISKHMEALLQLEGVSSSQNVKALRRLFDTINSHVRSLESLEVKEETYGALLCPVLVDKLPSEFQLIVSRKVPEAEWKFKTLMSTVEEEIIARERLGQGQSKTTRRSDAKNPSTATTLVTNDTPVPAKYCCYCSQEHYPTDCTVVDQVESRKQILKKTGRCFSCLRRGHLSRNCRASARCRRCQGKHHTSICTNSREPFSSEASTTAHGAESTTSNLNPTAPEFNPSSTSTLYADTSKPILLQTASAIVSNPLNSRSKKLRMIFDNGSQRSYLTQLARNSLHLSTVDRQKLAIAAFGMKRSEPRSCELVQVKIQTRTGEETSVDLFVVPSICEPLSEQPQKECIELYPHLTGLQLADDTPHESRDIDLLIGSDYYWHFVTGKVIHGDRGPVAVHTTLGWLLSGPAEIPDVSASLVTAHTLRVDDRVTNKMLDAVLKSFWDLESLGIESEPACSSVYDHFVSSVEKKDGRYEVSLPWRDCHDPLPSNLELSRRRLTGLLHRLKRNPEVLKEYNSIIAKQLQDGVIEPVKEEETNPTLIHYLPHHAVIRHDKDTTKVRIVYDASSKCVGPSLNNCLHIGPKFNQKINELLFRFRSYPVALVADIEKAFLSISIKPKDRNVLRFLWVENPFGDEVKPITLRFTRVVFGVAPSPFLLNATIRHHLEFYRSSKPDLVELLNHSFYVDDLVTGSDTEEGAYQLYLNSKEVLSQGSFNLRKFLSNSLNVQRQIEKAEAALNASDTNPVIVEPSEESFSEMTICTDATTHPGEQKVLGVRWNVQEDKLIFNLSYLAEKAMRLQPTKRNVVSVIGQIYDPLGHLAPITVSFKILMQEICKTKLGWDQPLAGELLCKWNNLVKALQQAKPFESPRHYFDGSVVQSGDQICLYGFCDASNMAYAAVVYIANGCLPPSLVVSKTRVAPLKAQTIPRLELMSAVLLARLVTNVKESLVSRYAILNCWCFTDSQAALYWIQGIDRDWKPFVQNRADEIRKLVPPQCWRHCSGKDNPADIPSRGIDPRELDLNELWKYGPKWLRFGEDHCLSKMDNKLPDQCLAELKSGSKHSLQHALLIPQIAGIGLVIDIERFSSTNKLYRVTAVVSKFIQLSRKKAISPEITRQDLTCAEEMWLSDSQVSLVKDERFSTWKTQFGLFQDQRKLWRCGGRLQNADLPYSAKHPILLNRKHHIAVLIIKDAHRRVGHNGVKETLTEIRSKFWIIRGRSLIRSVIYKCSLCKRFESSPFQGPPQPPLPEFRVVESPPFAFTAVDFAGPLYVWNKGTSHKVWLCLFTCCVTRAIHLEVVFDMATISFLRCVKRFAARRGLPRRFLSDNAKTFKSAAKALKKICNDPDAQSQLSSVGIDWSFNLEKAPWWGGLFERMIKSVKRCLRKVVRRARFSFDEMHTALVEIEAILNSRPLSYLHSDDLDKPLTPSHLLAGRRLLSLPDNLTYLEDDDDMDFELTTETLQRRAKYLNNVINHFWKRWSKEYLLELRDSHRQRKSKSSSNEIAPGDIVLVHDQSQPRGLWRLAKVQDLIVGRDGAVRGATLRVGAKDGSPTTLQRPLQLLYPLEISSGASIQHSQELQEPQEPQAPQESQEKQISAGPPQKGEQNYHSRPTRRAAVEGRKRTKQWCTDLIDHSSVVNWGEDVENETD